MTRVEELLKQIILFDLLADTLDTFGWFKLNDISFYK